MPRTTVGDNSGKAIYFPGGSTTRKVNAGTPSAVLSATSLSVSYWFNPQGAQNASGSRHFAIEGGTNTFRVQSSTAGTNINFIIDDGGARQANSNAGPVDGTWVHVVAIYDESMQVMTLYLDNTSAATNTQVTGALNLSGNTIFIGNHASSSREINGYIDDFRIYNKALNANERATLFAKKDVSDGLVLYYPFNSTNGLKTKDYSTTGSDGTLGASIALVTGTVPELRVAPQTARTAASSVNFGNCIQLDGTDDYLYRSSAVSTATNNFTIMAWINPFELPQAGMVVYNGESTQAIAFGIFGGAGIAGSNLFALYESVAWIDSGYTFPDAGKGYHITLQRDAGTTKFYVNGVRTLNTSSSTPLAPSAGFYIGARKAEANRFFNGLIDEVKYFNRVLTPSEILDDYNGTAVSATNLQASYSFTAGSGTTAADGSGNGNTLTLINQPIWVNGVNPPRAIIF